MENGSIRVAMSFTQRVNFKIYVLFCCCITMTIFKNTLECWCSEQVFASFCLQPNSIHWKNGVTCQNKPFFWFSFDLPVCDRRTKQYFCLVQCTFSHFSENPFRHRSSRWTHVCHEYAYQTKKRRPTEIAAHTDLCGY